MANMSESQADARLTGLFRSLRTAKQFLQGQDIDAVFSVPEKTLWLIMTLQGVLSDNPFIEYFTRSVSAYLMETTNALLRIGANQCAAEFSKAVEIFSPNQRREREAGFAEIGNSREVRAGELSEAEIELLDTCYERYFECVDSEQLMTRLEQYLQDSPLENSA